MNTLIIGIILAIVIILLIALSVISWYYFATIKVPEGNISNSSRAENLQALALVSGNISMGLSVFVIFLFISFIYSISKHRNNSVNLDNKIIEKTENK